MDTTIPLLSTAYLAPVDYYVQLATHHDVRVEAHEHYVKQTYRNRCVIAGTDGPMPLTIPIEKPDGDKAPMCDIRISDHGNWRHLHWNALVSAYRQSAFFEYYADDFEPFYTKKWDFLLDYNQALQDMICGLIDIQPHVELTTRYEQAPQGGVDLRMAITPKHDYSHLTAFTQKPYYQVFAQRNGFLPHLSIVDLLFNLGPESLLWLTGR